MDRMKNNLLTERLAYNGANDTRTHVHLFVYNAETFRETVYDRYQDIAFDIASNERVWLRVHGLKDSEFIKAICTHFNIDFLIIQDILNVNHPAKAEDCGNFNFLVSQLFHADEASTPIRIIQGKNYVISFSEGECTSFDGVVRALQDNVLKIRTRSSDYLFSVLVNELVSSFVSVAMNISDALDDLEDVLLTATTDPSINLQLQQQRRRYIELKRTVVPLRDQYGKMMHAASDLIAAKNRPFFNDVNDHLQNAVLLIDACRETLSSLTDLYISNNDLRMNDIMKRLTIVSTIFIPLTFLAGVWGMNFEFMPELGWRYGYLMAWCLMLLMGVVAYFIFKSKRWR